ncbi:hypothetical protein FEF65_10825 [Mariprofundus erugo]|uniref:Ion transport domain-containing protein n=1 Tax=Mariprofundus erugo TaxID=2528639 RepID=A0A5R9GMX5_9PROT|nr:hypothetical protein FEF65_10825 [Mariprofundus erugo]
MVITNDRALKYHHLEWVLGHPRFGLLMMALICMSFTHNQMLALTLFVLFTAEIVMRIALLRRKIKLNPYRSSTNRKIEVLLLTIDTIAVASLLVTVLNIHIPAEDLALARLMRGVYLLRSIRFIRYFDLHSAMFSPTYGMFISLVILISFFATDMMLSAIIIFFFIELSVRLIIMRSINFESRRDKITEWAFWWLDLIATIFMLPFITGFGYSSALRMLRLARLLRPWKIIVRNLMEVLREGQFMQEINLIVLFLAILSIGGGVAATLLFTDFDYTLGLYHKPIEHEVLSAIWFAFRLLTDPGNSVIYPGSISLAVFSIFAVILGVFIFSFFIGIGANIVSGLMRRLRNEALQVKNHMVILGWTPASPYIVHQLRIISDRSFARLKVVLLHHEDHPPAELINEKWVTYRQGAIDTSTDLRRINIGSAKQALMMLPEARSEAVSLAHSFYNLMAIRKENQRIKLSIAIPGMDHPRLNTHRHMLQVGWDNHGKYDQPTVILSEADFRATAFCNILRYSDFDQVLQRLMIPELMDESALQLASWNAELRRNENNQWQIPTPDGKYSADIQSIRANMFRRGVILLGIITDDWEIIPIYALDDQYVESLQLHALIGIAISDIALYDEAVFCIRESMSDRTLAMEEEPEAAVMVEDIDSLGLTLVEAEARMKLLVVGWVGSLPLLLKRLLRFYHELDLTILDNLSEEEVNNERTYIERRISDQPGMEELINIKIKPWNFNDMECLREHVKDANHIILSRASSMQDDAYAMISMVLSHIITITKDEEVTPQIFPVMENREQASMLQTELFEFELPADVHVTVPNEFYGIYVAHTSFHMYAVEEESDYQMKRVFRHTLDKLMSDSGENADMGLKIFSVSTPLPEDEMDLFNSLKEAGYIWIGYTLNTVYKQDDQIGDAINTVFPRQKYFSCKRQNQIVINPNGTPYSRRAWLTNRENIVELITIGGDSDVELF